MVNGISAFSIRDALDPAISQKLNYNFDILARAFTDPEVVTVSGKNPPEPRTDEMLWYKTDTGDLYLWAQGYDVDTGLPNGEWDWKKLVLGSIAIGSGDPSSTDVPPDDMFLYYDTDSRKLWIYQFHGGANIASWATFNDAVGAVLYWDWLRPDGSYHQTFVDAVHSLFPDPEIETSGFFTPDTSVIDVGTMQYTHDGSVAMVNMAFKLKSALSTGTTGNITNITIGTMNVGYRPLLNAILAIPERGGTVNISTNGSVQLANFLPNQTIGTDVTLYIRGTYILAPMF